MADDDGWGFVGPCVHGRDPWTRCTQGCDTEEQARGLKPPTPCCPAAAKLRAIRTLVDAQAEDPALWCHADTATEAYVKAELRRLHAEIERGGEG